MSIEAIRQARNEALAERAGRGETFAAQVTCGARDLVRSAVVSAPPGSTSKQSGWLEKLSKVGAIGSAREILETACLEASRGEVSRETLKASIGGVAEIGTKAAVVAGGSLALGGTALAGGSALAVVGATAVGFVVLPKLARAITDFGIDQLDHLAKRLGNALRERSTDSRRAE